MRLLLAILFALLASSAMAAEPWDDASEIPLKEIWALEMPGTHELRELGEKEQKDSVVGKVLTQIREMDWPQGGMAVEGEGRKALEQFSICLSTGVSTHAVSPEVPVTLVFFTKPISWDIQLVKVQKKGQRFRVWYRFAPVGHAEPQQHLALIPVGKLPDDRYWVTFERLPMEKDHLESGASEPSAELVNEAVCMSFAFEAADKEAAAVATQRRIIPLSSIWAWEMPGTRDINKLDRRKGDESLVTQLRQAIRETWNRDPAMAIAGEGMDALYEFHRIRVDEGKPKPLTDDVPISLVFFTDASGPYVHIHEIEREDNVFTIRYRPVPHDAAVVTRYIALIPVGKLRFGKYIVSIERSPMEQRYLEQGNREPAQDFGGRVVSHSFQFLVSRRR